MRRARRVVGSNRTVTAGAGAGHAGAGPARMDDRLVFQEILFVLFAGIGWEDLPRQLGSGPV